MPFTGADDLVDDLPNVSYGKSFLTGENSSSSIDLNASNASEGICEAKMSQMAVNRRSLCHTFAS
jgi:hypothetical protein